LITYICDYLYLPLRIIINIQKTIADLSYQQNGERFENFHHVWVVLILDYVQYNLAVLAFLAFIPLVKNEDTYNLGESLYGSEYALEQIRNRQHPLYFQM